MKKLFFTFSIIIFLVACNNEAKQKAGNVKDTVAKTQQTETISPVDEAIVKEAAKKQLDQLEKLFDNQNYRTINGKDTSYFYFSRLGKYNLFTHSYKLVKGDSANLKIDTIQLGKNSKLEWHWQGKQLVLNSVTDYMSSWGVNNNEKDKIEFQRIDSRTIELKHNEQKTALHKTLALSLFLVRSYYDYQHGTKYAQDTADNFKPKAGKSIK